MNIIIFGSFRVAVTARRLKVSFDICAAGARAVSDDSLRFGELDITNVFLLFIRDACVLFCVQNGRVAKQLTVGVRQAGDQSFSRCCALVRYDAVKMTSDSLAIIKSLNTAGSHQEAW